MATFYRVHELAVFGYTNPGGEVYDVIYDIAKDARNLAKTIYAPIKTGKLRKNIAAGRPDKTGPYGVSGYVSNNLKYAHFVHYGTTGPITAHGGQKMKFAASKPRADGTSFFIYAKSVSGQKANPYLARALTHAMANFRAGA